MRVRDRQASMLRPTLDDFKPGDIVRLPTTGKLYLIGSDAETGERVLITLETGAVRPIINGHRSRAVRVEAELVVEGDYNP